MAVASLTNSVKAVRRSTNFAEERFDGLKQMRKVDTLTDFVINVKDEVIRCHRLILAIASPYFRAMFSHNMSEKQSGEVRLENLNPKAVRDLVDYCYCGELDIPLDSVKWYLEAAVYFQLVELNATFDAFIAEHLQLSNCIGFYFYAEKYGLEGTKKKAENSRVSKLQEVSQMQEFQQLICSEVTDLLVKSAAVHTGDTLLQAAIDWIMSEEDRKNYIYKLLEHVKLDTCSSDYLKVVLNKYENTLLEDRDLYVHITKTMMNARPKECSLVIFGGRTGVKKLADKCWKLDTVSGECKKVVSHSMKYHSAVCATPAGIVVVGGGTQENCNAVTNSCDLLNMKTLKWTNFPDAPANVYGAGALCVDDQVFIIGGLGNREDTMECLDLLSRQWSSCPNMLQKVRYPIIAAVDHLIFVLFNTDPVNDDYKRGDEVSLQCYNTRENRWCFRSPVPATVTETCGARAVSVGTQMYVVGGRKKLCLRYSTQQDSWTILRSPKEMHQYGSATYLGGRIILCGGMHRGKSTETIETYDIKTDKWEIIPTKLPVPLMHLFVMSF